MAVSDQKKKSQEILDREFVALLREKADNTPIPLSLEPDFILSRLPGKKSPTLWERVSPWALTAAACIALVVTGNSGINEYLYCGRDYLTVASSQEIRYYEETGKLFGVDAEEFDSQQDAVDTHLAVPQKKTGMVATLMGKIFSPLKESSSSLTEGSRGNDSSAVSEDSSLPDSSLPNDPLDSSGESLDSSLENSGDPSDEVLDPASLDGSPDSSGESLETDDNDGSEEQQPLLPEGDLTYAGYFDSLTQGAIASAGVSYKENGNLRWLGKQDGCGGSMAVSGSCTYYLKGQGGKGGIEAVYSGDGVSASYTAVEYLFPEYVDMELLSVSSQEIFVKNNILAVTAEAIFSGKGGVRILSSVSLYDISSPLSPAYLDTFSQSGSYLGGRLQKGEFILVSDHLPGGAEIGSPESYMPYRHHGDDEELLGGVIDESGCFSRGCAVIAAIDTSSLGYIDTRALMGGGKSLYISETAVYLMENSGGETFLTKYFYGDNALDFVGETWISGRLYDGFQPVSEYKGNLRLITRTGAGFALTVLSPNLEQTGFHEEALGSSGLDQAYYDGSTLYLSLEGSFTGYVFDFRRLGSGFEAVNSLGGSVAFSRDAEGYLTVGSFGSGSGLVLFSYDNTGRLYNAAKYLSEGELTGEAGALYSQDGYLGGCYQVNGRYQYFLYGDTGSDMALYLAFDCGDTCYDRSFVEGNILYLISSHTAIAVDILSGTVISTINY